MMRADTPWVGLVALVAMFVLPFLPRWLFEGPRTIKHHPRPHICAECGAPWIDGHDCVSGQKPGKESLHGQLWRPSTATALERRWHRHSEADD
jgi:hypothetical protein